MATEDSLGNVKPVEDSPPEENDLSTDANNSEVERKEEPPAGEDQKEEKVVKNSSPDVDNNNSEIPAAVKAILVQCHALEDKAIAYSKRLKSEGDSLGQEALDLDKRIKKTLKLVQEAAERDEITSDVAEELEGELDRARGMVYEGDVTAVLPHKSPGFFLGIFLGNVNVLSARRDVRFKVKEGYNSYRDRTAVMFLAFPAILLALKYFYHLKCFPGFLVQAYLVWLLYFYTSLALRENILRVNGSDIKPWWIHHHYFAIIMCLVSLTWGIEGQDCAKKQDGVWLFLTWAVMQGCAMLLQNYYQRQRLYARIALGKAGRMDIVWGETAGIRGTLLSLYLVLFVLQAFQLFIGAGLFRTSLLEDSEWQVVACGVLLIGMAVGNFYSSAESFSAKMRFKAQKKKQLRQGS